MEAAAADLGADDIAELGAVMLTSVDGRSIEGDCGRRAPSLTDATRQGLSVRYRVPDTVRSTWLAAVVAENIQLDRLSDFAFG